MSGTENCCVCGRWCGAYEGILREAADGTVEMICLACRALENGRACPVAKDVVEDAEKKFHKSS